MISSNSKSQEIVLRENCRVFIVIKIDHFKPLVAIVTTGD